MNDPLLSLGMFLTNHAFASFVWPGLVFLAFVGASPWLYIGYIYLKQRVK